MKKEKSSFYKIGFSIGKYVSDNLAIILTILITIVILSFCGKSKAEYLPSINDQQFTIAYSERLDSPTKDRSIDISLLQVQFYSKLKIVGIGQITNRNNKESGAADFYTVVPLSVLYEGLPKIFDKIEVIGGLGVRSNLTARGGGGVQVDLEKAIIFLKSNHTNHQRAGIFFPYYERSAHVGFIYESENGSNFLGFAIGAGRNIE